MWLNAFYNIYFTIPLCNRLSLLFVPNITIQKFYCDNLVIYCLFQGQIYILVNRALISHTVSFITLKKHHTEKTSISTSRKKILQIWVLLELFLNGRNQVLFSDENYRIWHIRSNTSFSKVLVLVCEVIILLI